MVGVEGIDSEAGRLKLGKAVRVTWRRAPSSDQMVRKTKETAMELLDMVVRGGATSVCVNDGGTTTMASGG